MALRASGLACADQACGLAAVEERSILESVVDFVTAPLEKLVGASDWRDVRYTDISELTTRRPEDLDPATRARLEAVVAAGRARAAAEAQHRQMVKALLVTAGLVGGVYLLTRLIGKR